MRTDLHDPVEEIHASAKVADLTTRNLEAYTHYFRGDRLISEFDLGERERSFGQPWRSIRPLRSPS